MKTPILGGYETTLSSNASDNRLINLFPEVTPEGAEAGYLLRCSGLLTEFGSSEGSGNIRGMYVCNGFLFVVYGNELHKIWGSDYSYVIPGTIPGTGLVSMVSNNVQIVIGTGNEMFVYNTGSDVFEQITDPDFFGAGAFVYMAQRFVFNRPGTQQIYATNILADDGSTSITISSLDLAYADLAADKTVTVAANHNELWVFGEKSTEVWYNAGTEGFPFAPISGGFSEIGCLAKNSVVVMDNSLIWLGVDKNGEGCVYQARGYSPQKISTPSIDYKIQREIDKSNAVAYGYQKNGHEFYVISLPNTDETWVYDITTKIWHQRGYFENGEFKRHLGHCCVVFGGKVLIGSYLTRQVYSYDDSVYTEGGRTQKWVRSWRACSREKLNGKRYLHRSLLINCETGVGLESGQGSSPLMMLRYSDDGGHTWRETEPTSMGEVGEYGTRVKWWGLGASRDRIYEISGTDPVKIAIIGAELQVQAGYG